MTQVFGYTPPQVEPGEQYVRFVAVYDDGDTWEFQVRNGSGVLNTVKVPSGDVLKWLSPPVYQSTGGVELEWVEDAANSHACLTYLHFNGREIGRVHQEFGKWKWLLYGTPFAGSEFMSADTENEAKSALEKAAREWLSPLSGGGVELVAHPTSDMCTALAESVGITEQQAEFELTCFFRQFPLYAARSWLSPSIEQSSKVDPVAWRKRAEAIFDTLDMMADGIDYDRLAAAIAFVRHGRNASYLITGDLINFFAIPWLAAAEVGEFDGDAKAEAQKDIMRLLEASPASPSQPDTVAPSTYPADVSKKPENLNTSDTVEVRREDVIACARHFADHNKGEWPDLRERLSAALQTGSGG